MARKEFTKRTKVQAFERSKGFCEGCGAKLSVGKFQYDHTIPDKMTGEPTLANCRVLCTICHAEKTKGDVADIAKAKRREARHLGADTRKGPRLQGQGQGFRPAEPQRKASKPLEKKLPPRINPWLK